MFHRFGIWDTPLPFHFPFVFQLIGKRLMRVFTFSPIVSPKCESSWERVLFSVQGPSCLSCLPLTPPVARPPPSCQTSLLKVSLPLSLGFSQCAAGPAAPPHVLHCSRPPVSPAFVVICLFWGRWGAEEVLDLSPSTQLQNWEQAQVSLAPFPCWGLSPRGRTSSPPWTVPAQAH